MCSVEEPRQRAFWSIGISELAGNERLCRVPKRSTPVDQTRPLLPVPMNQVEQEAAMLVTAQKILELRKRGLTNYEVGVNLDIPDTEVERITEQCRDRVFRTIGPEIEHDRHLAVGILNDAVRGLREIAEHSYDYGERISAWNGVTKAIAAKSKIIGLEQASTVTNNLVNVTDQTTLELLSKWKETQSEKRIRSVNSEPS
jgi:hypothetical protein